MQYLLLWNEPGPGPTFSGHGREGLFRSGVQLWITMVNRKERTACGQKVRVLRR